MVFGSLMLLKMVAGGYMVFWSLMLLKKLAGWSSWGVLVGGE